MSDDSADKAQENFSQALSRLTEFMATPATTDREKAGIIQAFEFTFETCWKLMQKIARNQGVDIASPKKAIGFAFKSGLIDNEDKWLEILGQRNLTSHIYRGTLVDEILRALQSGILAEFTLFSQRLDS